MNKCHTKLLSYGGHNLSVKAKVTYTAEYKRKYYPIEFVIVNERAPAILGLETSIKTGLAKRVNQMNKEESVLDEFKSVFQGLGRLKQTHSIRLKPECEPVIHPARRVPYRLQEQFDKTLSDMVRSEIITKVTEPTEWVNPIVTVRKPSGALRIPMSQSARTEQSDQTGALLHPNAGSDCRETTWSAILQHALCYFGVSANSAGQRQ